MEFYKRKPDFQFSINIPNCCIVEKLQNPVYITYN